jgi:uncharacterized protein YcaQ
MFSGFGSIALKFLLQSLRHRSQQRQSGQEMISQCGFLYIRGFRVSAKKKKKIITSRNKTSYGMSWISHLRQKKKTSSRQKTVDDELGAEVAAHKCVRAESRAANWFR